MQVAMPVSSRFEVLTPYGGQPRGAENTDYEVRVGVQPYLDHLNPQDVIYRSNLGHIDVCGVV